jgi:uncharacterized protein YdiU (UPF0061 family)
VSLSALVFDNRFVAELPGDPSTLNRPRPVLGACYSRVNPTPVAAPRLLALSDEVARLLELDPATLDAEELAQVFAGNRLLPGMEPFAACYGGHQFGHWAGQLGDGRAIVLGEMRTSTGAHYELQLKGAGPTPYSRTADGRAVLRSSLREFLCSEAMHHLGVPTTRALCLVTTGEQVLRDMFYDGHPKLEPGAVVCRVAPTFLRFGNYELFAARDDLGTLRTLVDHTLRRHFPELGAPGATSYAALIAEVARRTARMVSEWMRVGFVHGVMNTDNMSILGLTIDYGPYGFLDVYEPDWTPNTTDAQGRRYRYEQQPQVAFWNLVQLANALVPLVGGTEPLEEALGEYPTTLGAADAAMWAHKLGLSAADSADDRALVGALLGTLRRAETDFTIFFRRLVEVPVAELPAADAAAARLAPLAEAFYAELSADDRAAWGAWLERYASRVRADGLDPAERRRRMLAANPRYLLRNYLAQQAIDQAEQGELGLLRELLEVLRRPYDEQPGHASLDARRPEWARQRAGCSMLSCSS